MRNQELYWYWLVNIKGISRKNIHLLLTEFRTPESIFYASFEQLIKVLQNEKKVENIIKSKDFQSVMRSYDQLKSQNIHFTFIGDENYPKNLLNIMDSPLGLYYKGRLPDERKKSVAIIGARNCTRYGIEMAEYFGKGLAEEGVNVISGLARGIDGYGHIGALKGNGYTLGVLGGGIDQVYPKENYRLFMEMEEKGGILSESNIGIKPFSSLFPERNRIISGLCDGILVIEAMEKSGTFITVNQGLEQGKDIFAIPGRIMDTKSVGCNNLIKLGAHMVTDVSDVLQFYQMDCINSKSINEMDYKEKIVNKMSLAPIEKIVYSCLQIEPKYLDDIIYEVDLAPQEACKALNHLVLLGLIDEPVNNYYGLKIC